jgi:hypothetical protein
MGFRHFSMKKHHSSRPGRRAPQRHRRLRRLRLRGICRRPGGRPGDRCGDRCRDGAAPVIWTGIHGMDGFDWENHGDIDGNMVNIAIMVNMIGLI